MGKRSPKLPLQEKQRRRRERTAIIVIIFLVIALTSLLLYVSGSRGEALLPQNLLVFLLINVNAILLLLLIFLVVRNVVKLVFERRRGILGSKLRAKLVIAFVGLSLVPTLLLFWVSIGFITNTIENWFSFKVETTLEEAFSVTEAYYNNASSNALYYATQLSRHITDNKLLSQMNLDILRDFIYEKQTEYNLGVVEVYSSQKEELVKAMNPQVPDAGFISAESSLVQQALEGGEIVRIQPAGESDIIRGVVPVYSSWSRRDVVGVIVVNYYVPRSLVSKMDSIARAFQDYKQLKLYKNPIKYLYVILLSVVTLLIIFSATWFGFHLSKVIAVPISSLASATEQIARGNLDIEIEPAADDEIGVLVDSFNKMTRDLRVSREQVEQTTCDLRDMVTELDHRRIYMETLLENVAAVVVSIDRAGIITNFNIPAQAMFGLPLESALRHPYAEVFASEELRPLKLLIDEVTRMGLGAVERQITLSFAQRTAYVFVRSNMLFDNEGNYMGLVLVGEDLTQIQQAQRAYAWREVARRIAHEIKNPLTPIKLNAQRVLKKFAPQISSGQDTFADCLGTIVAQVDDLKRLVNEFSSFAKMPATKPRANDIHEIIEETLLLYREAHRDVSFVFKPGRSVSRLSLDGDQIKRVLINLLDNAVAALENDGCIVLRTEYKPKLNMVTVEVADNGCGVPPELKPRIFDPYVSTKKDSTGLGLAIVSTIIADHGGYIRVRDNQPRGTCFVIELPVNHPVSIGKVSSV
jgi:two-component system, NtrC family, nitrogen regulation sensor histidine kinase NtrY